MLAFLAVDWTMDGSMRLDRGAMSSDIGLFFTPATRLEVSRRLSSPFKATEILIIQMNQVESTRTACSDAIFSPLESDQELDVVKTRVNIALPLEEAVWRLADNPGSTEEDDAEGCPISSCESSLSSSTSLLHSVSLRRDPTLSPPNPLPTQTSGSDGKGEHISNKKARDKAYRHKKKQQKRDRERSKLEHTFPSPKFKITPALSAKLSKVTNWQVPNNTANLHAAKGAWIGVRGEIGQENSSLEALLAKGYTYKTWDGM